ncbi:MAG: nucleotidyl transferase AbiEii/AbiGii toxin family protein [Candidatus Omnitrophica bacterium]|nr:nucleotidyl transferase AbiEii/AbiGii toxin family protein [Candidatus Omnitrophota bacterium]
MLINSPLQVREVFHLEFLRWLGRKLKPDTYVLKGGVNLRFFFHSIRYSEDIDLDVERVAVDTLIEMVMNVLNSQSFQDTLRPFGIEKIIPPDIKKAKQTQTTQPFKVHLITASGEDLFIKIEFSRRGFKEGVRVEEVMDTVLRAYKLPPILVPHYDADSMVSQKIKALVTRAFLQARDVFDLHLLSSQYDKSRALLIEKNILKKAYQNVLEISFEQFRDSVVSYLSVEDQNVYDTRSVWDGIKLKVCNFIDELINGKT